MAQYGWKRQFCTSILLSQSPYQFTSTFPAVASLSRTRKPTVCSRSRVLHGGSVGIETWRTCPCVRDGQSSHLEPVKLIVENSLPASRLRIHEAYLYPLNRCSRRDLIFVSNAISNHLIVDSHCSCKCCQFRGTPLRRRHSSGYTTLCRCSKPFQRSRASPIIYP